MESYIETQKTLNFPDKNQYVIYLFYKESKQFIKCIDI